MKRLPAPTTRLIGYARVSTVEQNLDMQIAALTAAGVHVRDIYTDQVSALAKSRPGMRDALRAVAPGDTLVVWKLDRFGRSAIHLLNEIEALTKRGVGFRSLTESFDTSTPIGKLALAMLAAFAEFERNMIAERTRAGMERRKAAGGTFGQPRILDVAKARKMFRDGKSVDEVRAAFRGTRGNTTLSRAAIYREFSGPEIWLLQGKDIKTYPRRITREKLRVAVKAARKK